jgi:hypothetical protein
MYAKALATRRGEKFHEMAFAGVQSQKHRTKTTGSPFLQVNWDVLW